jgi:hypothetical protein
MNRAVRVVLAVGLGMGLVASMISCASTPKMTGPGFLGDRAMLLEPGPKGGVKERWLKPGADFKKYNKIILEHVVFFFDDASEYKGIDTAELDEVAKKADLALVNALKDNYPIVAEPGPDVVRMKTVLGEKSRPISEEVTYHSKQIQTSGFRNPLNVGYREKRNGEGENDEKISS